MNIYDTYYMLAAVREIPLEHTFFRNRYFPTDTAMDIFGTSRVLADYAKGTQKKAPFVLPRIGAIPVGRDGFSTYELEPANISVSIPLTIDQLESRGFGESLLSNMTPEDRAKYFLMHDLDTLSQMISRTEEFLAVQTMLDNGATMRHLTEKPDVYKDIKVKFYDGDNNPAQFTPANNWTHSTKSGDTWTPGNWYGDMCAMVKMLTGKGRRAKEFVVAPDVADFLMTDGWFCAMLDNRNVDLGIIKPETMTEDVYSLGTFNFNGRRLPILVDTATYEENDNDVAYLPAGTVVVTAPDVGKGIYGAVSQVEKDEKLHTHAGTRIPQHLVDIPSSTIETKLSARPLFVPKTANPWTVAKNVLGS
ncbi:MAG: major capsid protein [Clostridia bacterium]|nr:major capsid protein [Clostridia bacterium]